MNVMFFLALTLAASPVQPVTPLNLAQTAKGSGQATIALQRCHGRVPLNIIRLLLNKNFPWNARMMDLVADGALDGLSAAEAIQAARCVARGVPADVQHAPFTLSDLLRWRSCFKEADEQVLKAWLDTQPIKDMDNFEFKRLWNSPDAYRDKAASR